MTPIDDDNYERLLLASPYPVLLVFQASFCGPSALMLPLIDGLADDFPDVAVFDVDVETCPRMTRAMHIKGTPSMVLLKRGEPVASRLGTSNYKDLSDWLAKNRN